MTASLPFWLAAVGAVLIEMPAEIRSMRRSPIDLRVAAEHKRYRARLAVARGQHDRARQLEQRARHLDAVAQIIERGG